MLGLNEDDENKLFKYLDMSMKEATNKMLEEQRIKILMLEKQEELVKYLKEKYPEEFI